MTEPTTDQVAVYLDFDNIVISHYDELHGRGAFHNDNAGRGNSSPEVAEKLAAAHVDLKAIFEYAASFGTVSISRAYADWSAPVNASYKNDTVAASIDLVQMFPLSRSKNGADIRLAIDVIDDLSRYNYVSHVLIVAGDSDYVSLAQRCKRLGRTVVGVGAAHSVGRYWEAACDVFRYYDALPGLPPVASRGAETPAPATDGSTALLLRAVPLATEKSADGWTTAGALKSLMLRLDPSFDEKLEGHSTFTAYLNAHGDVIETRSADNITDVRLRAATPAKKATRRPAKSTATKTAAAKTAAKKTTSPSRK
jgi:hypothetical protein